MTRGLTFALTLTGLVLASPAYAHDVSGSDVKVYAQGGSVEVWQSTPYGIAHGLLKTDPDAQTEVDLSQAQQDEMAMVEISKGWVISSNQNNVCTLARQAHRRVHNDDYLQIRYLFTCPEEDAPAQLSMPWLDKTPSDHIITLHMNQGVGERTYFVARPNYSFPISQ